MSRPDLLDPDVALARLLAQARAVSGSELVPTMAADRRVLAADVRSTVNVPPMDNAQMDGYALRAVDAAPDRALPVTQRIAAGSQPAPLPPGQVARIFTGAPIPLGADAVVMQEAAVADGETVRFAQAPAPGQWIRRTGEDIAAGSMVLAAGTRLTPQSCGLAASVGIAELPVRQLVRVACFFTGDELTMPGEPLAPGAIYNSNRFVLTAMLARLGCQVHDLGIVPDSLDATRAALREAAARCDLIVTSGGMSVGEEDHVRPAVAAEGRIDLWSIALKPGKPLAYGEVRRAGSGHAHFIGLPGNPVSSLVTFVLFVRPFIRALAGETAPRMLALPVRADFDWPKPDRRREFLRARLNAQGGLDLFPNQGSAVLTSTVWADGLVDNPAGRPIRAGEPVRFLPFADLI